MPKLPPPSFWDDEAEAMVKVIQPIIVSAATKAARLAFDDLVLQVGGELGVSWDVVNEAAIKWAQGYSYEFVKGINETSKNLISESIARWIESGEPLDALIDALAPYFGSVRAGMIGVTETTRVFQNGAAEFWRNSGVVSGYNYRSVEDPLVCPICEPLNKQTFALDDNENMPPQHVNCRCFSVPVLATEKSLA